MRDVSGLKDHVYDIVGALHAVHDELGPGVNEYCYQEALAMELSDRGIPFEREKTFHPHYKGRPLNAEYRIDFSLQGQCHCRMQGCVDLDIYSSRTALQLHETAWDAMRNHRQLLS